MLLINVTVYALFPLVISFSPPDSIMCSDVSAVSPGASLTPPSLVAASFSPNTSCPIEGSMYHTVVQLYRYNGEHLEGNLSA